MNKNIFCALRYSLEWCENKQRYLEVLWTRQKEGEKSGKRNKTKKEDFFILSFAFFMAGSQEQCGRKYTFSLSYILKQNFTLESVFLRHKRKEIHQWRCEGNWGIFSASFKPRLQFASTDFCLALYLYLQSPFHCFFLHSCKKYFLRCTLKRRNCKKRKENLSIFFL